MTAAHPDRSARPVREAMIVAGGAGTRLRPLTATTPKPLLPFCGAPFLTGMVQRLAAVGVRRVLLVVGADTAPFERFAATAALGDVEVEVVPEPQPLDTAGGVVSALDRVTGTFLVLNGDILTDVDLAAAIAAHHRAGAGASLVLTRVEDTSTYGVCVLDGSRITAFVEKPAPGTLPGQDTVNAGTYVLEPDVLVRFPAGRLSFERQVFPDLVADGVHVAGVVGDGHWADLGTPARFLDGHLDALAGALRWPSLDAVPADAAGVRLAADVEVAADATVEGPALLGAGVRVEAGAHVGPGVCIGAGTVVGPGARVRETVTFAGARIGARADLARVLAGVDAELGAGVVAPGRTAGGDPDVGAGVPGTGGIGAGDGPEVVVADGVVVPPRTVLAPGARLAGGER
jgi:mannose-1-phosphate guanylyltransferase